MISKYDQFPDLYLEITNKCNINCDYCYIHDKGVEQEPVDIGDLVNAIDSINPSKLYITGGEPLLYPTLIDNLLRYYESTYSRHWRVVVFSNLILDINEDISSLFEHIEGVQTSWSYERSKVKTGMTLKRSIDVLEANISHIRKTFKNIEAIDINLTITPKTIDEYKPEDLIKDLEYMNPDGVNFETVSYSTDEDLSEYYDKADEYLLECFKLMESSKIENLTKSTWNKSIKNNMTMHCTVCADANVRLFDPITKTIKHTCPCYTPQGGRKRKLVDKCLQCDYFKYCRMDCERFGNNCAFPKKTFKYFLETL